MKIYQRAGLSGIVWNARLKFKRGERLIDRAAESIENPETILNVKGILGESYENV